MVELFKGQVAVITGAGEGIGFEIARRLVAGGALVVLNDVDSEKAKEASASLSGDTNRCIGVAGDVGDVEVVRGLVKHAVQSYGRIDLVIANAGITIWNDFVNYRPEDFHRIISVNLGGSFFLAQSAAKEMIAQKSGGRILLMSSVAGHSALPYLSAYSMTKSGLEGLARNLVAELSPHGITINVIAPGATVTPRNLNDDPDYEQAWGELYPTGRACMPADIAETAMYLLSPGAGQITGQTLIVDGGWTSISPTPALDFVEGKKPTPDSNN